MAIAVAALQQFFRIPAVTIMNKHSIEAASNIECQIPTQLYSFGQTVQLLLATLCVYMNTLRFKQVVE